MTIPTHDLSKLRIDRDPSPEVRRAFGRNLILFGIAVVVIGGGVLFMRGRSRVTVQTVVVTTKMSDACQRRCADYQRKGYPNIACVERMAR